MRQSQFFNKLSWILLEAKIKYYLFPGMENISDTRYDKLEKIYLKMCSHYEQPNTIQSMVGVDKTRPSVQAAISKICRDNYYMAFLNRGKYE